MLSKWIAILIFTFIFFQSVAQADYDDDLYLSGEVNLGNYVGINVNANYVIEEKYSFQGGFSVHLRNSKSRPINYSTGLISLYSPDMLSFDYLRSVHFLIGKIYNLNELGSARVNLAGGIGYTRTSRPENWRPIGIFAPFPIGSNYAYDVRQLSSIGIIFNPKFEFPFSKFLGFTISPMFVFSRDAVFVGLGFGGMIGGVRSNAPSRPGFLK